MNQIWIVLLLIKLVQMDVIVNLPLDVQQCRQFVFFPKIIKFIIVSHDYTSIDPLQFLKHLNQHQFQLLCNQIFQLQWVMLNYFLIKNYNVFVCLGITNKTNHIIINDKQFHCFKTNFYLFEGSSSRANIHNFAGEN